MEIIRVHLSEGLNSPRSRVIETSNCERQLNGVVEGLGHST